MQPATISAGELRVEEYWPRQGNGSRSVLKCRQRVLQVFCGFGWKALSVQMRVCYANTCDVDLEAV